MKFRATYPTTYPNGAIGWSPGGPYDCIGPFAKVQNCPIRGTTHRLTCYAVGYTDTWFSIPAYTRYRGKRVTGYFTGTETGTEFVPHDRHLLHLLGGNQLDPL